MDKVLGHRLLKSGISQGVYYVQVPPGAAAGRVITSTIKAVKGLDLRALVFLGAQKATLSARKDILIHRYRDRMNNGCNSRKGPNYPRTPGPFFRRMVRGMLRYKDRQQDLYKAVVVNPDQSLWPVVYQGKRLDLKFKDLRLHHKMSILQLTSHL